MDYADIHLLGVLRHEVSTTHGVAPLNFFPFSTVEAVLHVRNVVPRSAPVTPQGTLFSVELPCGEDYRGCAVAALTSRGEAAAAVQEFVPWFSQSGVVLEAEGVPELPHVKLGAAEKWAYALAIDPSKSTLTYTYSDTRRAKNVRQACPVCAVVVLRLGDTVDLEKRKTQLLQTLPRLSSGDVERMQAAVQSDDICVTGENLRLSTKDQALFVRIVVPVRARHCMHMQCHDLHSLLHVLQSQRVPARGLECSICSSKFFLRDLFVDTTFEAFLQQTKEDSLSISRDDYHQHFSPELQARRRLLAVIKDGCDVVQHKESLYVLTDVVPGTASSPAMWKGRVLSPFVSVPHHFVKTGIVETFPQELSRTCNGQWMTYASNPCCYFVRDVSEGFSSL